jgi:hypothetical protein
MDTIEAILGRKVQRTFSDKPVEADKLSKIVDAGRHAMSARNLQPWQFIVVRDRERLKAMGALCTTSPMRRRQSSSLRTSPTRDGPTLTARRRYRTWRPPDGLWGSAPAGWATSMRPSLGKFSVTRLDGRSSRFFRLAMPMPRTLRRGNRSRSEPRWCITNGTGRQSRVNWHLDTNRGLLRKVCLPREVVRDDGVPPPDEYREGPAPSRDGGAGCWRGVARPSGSRECHPCW